MEADDKKILQVMVERLVGVFGEEDEDEDFENNPLRGFLKRNSVENSAGEENHEEDGEAGDRPVSESEIVSTLERHREANKQTAKEVERMVEAGQGKLSAIDETNSYENGDFVA